MFYFNNLIALIVNTRNHHSQAIF